MVSLSLRLLAMAPTEVFRVHMANTRPDHL